MPATAPTTMARPSAATMPRVEPIQTPTQSLSAARVIVASMVLSPSSASRKEEVTTKNAGAAAFWARLASASVSLSPRSVHRPKTTNMTPAMMPSRCVGSAAPR